LAQDVPELVFQAQGGDHPANAQRARARLVEDRIGLDVKLTHHLLPNLRRVGHAVLRSGSGRSFTIRKLRALAPFPPYLALARKILFCLFSPVLSGRPPATRDVPARPEP